MSLPEYLARTPTPGVDWNDSGDSTGRSGNRCAALFKMAEASGCSDSFSAIAASLMISSSVNPEVLSTMRTSVTSGSPLVRVPVLSKTTVSIFWVLSRYSPPLMRIPFSAPFPAPTTIAAGVANPKAHGQAIMRTATAAVNPKLTAWCPMSVQDRKESMATDTTIGTKYFEIVSTSLSTGPLVVSASCTTFTIFESVVSAPTLVALVLRDPCRLMVPPIT